MTDDQSRYPRPAVTVDLVIFTNLGITESAQPEGMRGLGDGSCVRQVEEQPFLKKTWKAREPLRAIIQV